jgi:hypothetical protein
LTDTCNHRFDIAVLAKKNFQKKKKKRVIKLGFGRNFSAHPYFNFKKITENENSGAYKCSFCTP